MPQLAVVSRPAPQSKMVTRCAYCHGGAGAQIRPCVTCGALLHPECWLLAGRCPTIGCRIVVRRTTPAESRRERRARQRLAAGSPSGTMRALWALTILGLLLSVVAIVAYTLQPAPRPRGIVVCSLPAEAEAETAGAPGEAVSAADQRFRATLAFEDWFAEPNASLEPAYQGLTRLRQRGFEDERLLAYVELVRGNHAAARVAFQRALTHRPKDPFTSAWLVSLGASPAVQAGEPAWLEIVRLAAGQQRWDLALERAFYLSDDVERCSALTHLALLAETSVEQAQLAPGLYRDAAEIEGDAVRFWQHRYARVRTRGFRD